MHGVAVLWTLDEWLGSDEMHSDPVPARQRWMLNSERTSRSSDMRTALYVAAGTIAALLGTLWLMGRQQSAPVTESIAVQALPTSNRPVPSKQQDTAPAVALRGTSTETAPKKREAAQRVTQRVPAAPVAAAPTPIDVFP